MSLLHMLPEFVTVPVYLFVSVCHMCQSEGELSVNTNLHFYWHMDCYFSVL